MAARQGSASAWRLAAFSTAGLPVGALIVSLAVYLPHYYTSTLGLPLAVVGGAFALVRLIDICLDPILGVIMDRHTHAHRPLPAVAVRIRAGSDGSAGRGLSADQRGQRKPSRRLAAGSLCGLFDHPARRICPGAR